MSAVGVIGSGAFATALAGAIAGRGQEVVMHADDAATAKEINESKKNERRLAGYTLPAGVKATVDLGAVTRAARLLILAVPSPKVNDVIRQLGDVVDGHHLLVHAIGAPASDGASVSDKVREETCIRRIGALAGPALARDLADGKPCAILCASPFSEVVNATKAALHVPGLLHVYRSHDLPGTEIASALSGAMTIGLGLADGSGLGAGPRALLVVRATSECIRLVMAAGGRDRTFVGLAGLGNLLVRASSSSSERSDDYQLGLALARGIPPARRETEGARGGAASAKLAQRLGVRVPILDAVVAVVSGAVSVKQAATRLMETAIADEE